MPSAVDLNSDSQQYGLVNLLTYELSHLESEYSGSNPSSKINKLNLTSQANSLVALLLYFRCAQLHIRLYALFNSPTSQNYINSLLSLYGACQSLLELVLTSSEDVSSHCPNYIFQMILASALTVRKVLESPMIEYVDATAAKVLFNSAIVAIRKISVSNNDIPGRLAEVLAQLKARGNRAPANKTSWQSFHLKVRSRMSMSILFDSLWEWRNGFAAEESRGSSRTSWRSPAHINQFFVIISNQLIIYRSKYWHWYSKPVPGFSYYCTCGEKQYIQFLHTDPIGL